MDEIALPIIGTIFLIFRIWIGEIKLKHELDFRKHFVSRFACYYFCIALILNLDNELFNFITVGSIPVLTIAFITFDVPFFIKFHKESQVDQETTFWLYIERIMLHPPMLIAGYIIYAFNPKLLIPSIQFSSVLVGVIMIFGVFFLFDDRALKKEGTGLWLLFGMSGSIIGIVFFLAI